jgi:hypothetical protein
MVSFGLIIGIILFGMVIDATISKARKGKVNLSRGWYLILGLPLTLLSMGAPLALLHELRNPNPNIQTFSISLTVCFALGCYLILRFFIAKRTKAEQDIGGNVASRRATL